MVIDHVTVCQVVCLTDLQVEIFSEKQEQQNRSSEKGVVENFIQSLSELALKSFLEFQFYVVII